MLQRIRLINFKSFVDEEVKLAPLPLLVGANASGKSNVLDAIRFLQGARSGCRSTRSSPRAAAAVRAEHHPNEMFAEPFLDEHAPRGSPGRGRAWAMHALDRKTWRALLDLCPELDELKQKIAAVLAARSA